MSAVTTFRRLLASAPLQRGVILSSGQGSAQVELQGGVVVVVRGEGTVGASVFVKAGAIEGPAPTLGAMTTLEV